MFKKIMLATDFSDCAAHAQLYAFALAARFSSELHVAHVVDTTFINFAGAYGLESKVKQHITEMKERARQQLTAIANIARGAGLLQIRTHLLVGLPPEAIVEEAQRFDCELLITGKHGRSGFDVLLGSNAQRIVRFSTIPVLTLTSHGREFVHDGGEFTLKNVLCPCDLSPLEDRAVDFAAEICRAFGAELTLLHVIENPLEYSLAIPDVSPPVGDIRNRAMDRLNAIAEKLKDVKVNTVVASGVPNRQIEEIVRDRSIQLIVMSTHGRSGLSRALLGSTAEKVVRTSLVPTITIRPAQ